MSDNGAVEYPCPARHPSSGHFCERQAPHDGDHWTYDERPWPSVRTETAPQATPGNDPEMRVRGGEKDAAQLGLVREGQQGLGTCLPRAYLSRLRAWLSPRWPELPDDIHQSIDDQTRVRTEWIRRNRHG